jgi:hypothetical protein
LIAAFQRHLEEILRKATARVTAILYRDLQITDGKIDATPGNNRILRRLDKLFAREMDEAGYAQLVEAFVQQFPKQLPFLDEVIAYLHEKLPEIPATVQFSAQDLSLLKSFQVTAVASIEGTVDALGGLAMRSALFAVGGLKFADLVETLAEKFAVSIAHATTMAETSQATFYRTATDRAFQSIEEDVPQIQIKYEYAGPNDKKTRLFCRHLLQVKKAYTRAEIGEMDNGAFPVGSVFVTGGGWSCRHTWLLAV